MKKIIEYEIAICDICGVKESCHSCMNCGKDICHDCADKHAVKYYHSVYVGGSGDGFYCIDCDKKLRMTGGDKKHAAYLKIKKLRDLYKQFYQEFQKEAVVANENLKRILEEEEAK